MDILNVGYGITNPKTLLHLVQSNITLTLQDDRNSGDGTVNINFKQGNNDIFGDNTKCDWTISNSNSLFCIKRASNNITSNVIVFDNSGNVDIANDISIGGNFMKNNRDVILDNSNYVLNTFNLISTNLNADILRTSNVISTRITNLPPFPSLTGYRLISDSYTQAQVDERDTTTSNVISTRIGNILPINALSGEYLKYNGVNWVSTPINLNTDGAAGRAWSKWSSIGIGNNIYYGSSVKIGGDKDIETIGSGVALEITGDLRVTGTITVGWDGDGGDNTGHGLGGVGDGGYWIEIGENEDIYYPSNIKIGGNSTIVPTQKLEVTGNINVIGNYMKNGQLLNYSDIDGILSINNGGTGATDKNTAINNLLPSASTGQYLNFNGTNWSSITLPVATSSVLGGVTQGDNINITTAGVISAVIPVASDTVSGGIIVGANLTITNGVLSGTNANSNILATSNAISTNLNTSILSTSNYTLNTSNAISARVTGLDLNSSNYTLNTSNVISTRLTGLDLNSSNYTLNTSNAISARVTGLNTTVDANNLNSSNYTLNTSNVISTRLTGLNLNSSNYTLNTSNVISTRLTGLDLNSSNYTLNTSNVISIRLNSGTEGSRWGINGTNINYIAGNVGIGTNNPTNRLTVSGNITATGDISSGFSDNRLKTFSSTINNPLEIVNKLNGFYYTPNDLALSFGIVDKVKEVGLSAQEVQSVFPEIVRLAPFDSVLDSNNNIVSKTGDNYLTIAYERLAPLFVESIKELTKKIDAMEKELEELKKLK